MYPVIRVTPPRVSRHDVFVLSIYQRWILFLIIFAKKTSCFNLYIYNCTYKNIQDMYITCFCSCKYIRKFVLHELDTFPDNTGIAQRMHQLSIYLILYFARQDVICRSSTIYIADAKLSDPHVSFFSAGDTKIGYVIPKVKHCRFIVKWIT